jgi:hypothetical protein
MVELMDSGKARKLYEKYAGVMAYVSVEDADGDQKIGSAFHIGQGVFVTARHVIEDKRILEIAMTEPVDVRLRGAEAVGAKTRVREGDDEYGVHRVDNAVLQVSKPFRFHPDTNVDIALFEVSDIDPRTPYAPLGAHLDDWIGRGDFVLTEAIILGYPPIPFSTEPHLVAARAEVNAVVNLRRPRRHVHFILSAMPRGGFSGGLVLSEQENVLGVVTDSLLVNNQVGEIGFFAVLSVEAIFHCLPGTALLPSQDG